MTTWYHLPCIATLSQQDVNSLGAVSGIQLELTMSRLTLTDWTDEKIAINDIGMAYN